MELTLRQALALSGLIDRWEAVTIRKPTNLDAMPKGSLCFTLITSNTSVGREIHGGMLPDGSTHT